MLEKGYESKKTTPIGYNFLNLSLEIRNKNISLDLKFCAPDVLFYINKEPER